MPKFVKVMPKDYKRVLQALKKVEDAGLSGDEAIMAAFEANAHDVARDRRRLTRCTSPTVRPSNSSDLRLNSWANPQDSSNICANCRWTAPPLERIRDWNEFH